MLHSRYMNTRPMVIAFAQEKNTFVAPQISTHTNAMTWTPTCRAIALSGVFRFALTLPTILGSTPAHRVPGPGPAVEARDGQRDGRVQQREQQQHPGAAPYPLGQGGDREAS